MGGCSVVILFDCERTVAEWCCCVCWLFCGSLGGVVLAEEESASSLLVAPLLLLLLLLKKNVDFSFFCLCEAMACIGDCECGEMGDFLLFVLL